MFNRPEGKLDKEKDAAESGLGGIGRPDLYYFVYTKEPTPPGLKH